MNKEVPHITLFGPAETNDIRRVTSAITNIGQKYTLVPFKIGGFSIFKKPNKVIYLDVIPSPQLEQFRWGLAYNLMPVCRSYSEYDTGRVYKFHSTIKICHSIDDNRFNTLCEYIENKCSLKDYERDKMSFLERLVDSAKERLFREEEMERSIGQHLLRVTVLGKGRRILFEYDLILRQLLNRGQALHKDIWGKTISKFKELLLRHQSYSA
jgi:2'-5' RNA ligase